MLRKRIIAKQVFPLSIAIKKMFILWNNSINRSFPKFAGIKVMFDLQKEDIQLSFDGRR